MVEPLTGTTIEKFPFQHLRLIADLIYFEGPLLSYFKDSKGHHYLYYWCDCDDLHNRWLVFRATPAMLNQFLTLQISLRDLILSAEPNFSYWVDLDNQLNPTTVRKAQPSKLPESYLPETDSYYDASLSIFRDDQAAREVIVLMQQQAQETKSKLQRFEQAAIKHPEMFPEVLAA